MNIEQLYHIYNAFPKICTDTRNIQHDCLFFALKGENFNANTFAEQALKNGAAYAIIDEPDFKISDKYILVADVLTALQQLALYHRKQLNIPIIGLTGSNGKTTTKELIKSVLDQKYKTAATKGNLNNHIGVPLTLLSIDKSTEVAIIEMGANHQKEIAFLCSLSLPDYGLITNVGKAHLDGFGGFEGVKKGKGELYSFLEQYNKTLIINKNNSHLMQMLEKVKVDKIITYGSDTDNYVTGKLIENNPYLSVEWEHQGKISKVNSALTGEYNFENILAAITIGILFNVDYELINNGIKNYIPQNNRSQIVKSSFNTIICDYYNANPTSMIAAIDNLQQLKADNKMVLLGDMFELGDASEKEHKSVFEATQGKNFDFCVFIGKEFYKLYENSSAKNLFFDTVVEALEYFKKNKLSNNFILLKGSRSMKLELLMEIL